MLVHGECWSPLHSDLTCKKHQSYDKLVFKGGTSCHLKKHITDFAVLNKVRAECDEQCVVRLNGQIIQDVSDFENLGLLLCKHKIRPMNERKKAMKESKVIGLLEYKIKAWTVQQ